MSKILLAEDDTDMRRFLVKALQNAGFDVTSYSSMSLFGEPVSAFRDML